MKLLKFSTMLNVLVVTVLVVGALALGTASVKAQDTPRVNCDSTTVLLLYLAERYWGFESTALDLTQFETGQFTPYFGEITMGEPGAAQPTEEAAATPEATPEGEAAEPTAEATPAGEMTTLNPAVIADEDPMCAQLRQELETFFWERISAGTLGDVGAGGAGTGDTGAGTGDTGAMGTSVNVNLVDGAIEMESTVAAGTVTFNITNSGTMEHSFEIEGNGVEEELEPHLQPGESGTLTVDLQPGTYEVYCPVGDHAEQGMRLDLTVQ